MSNSNKCDAEKNICSAMPISDPFSNPDASDCFSLIRKWNRDDSCGRKTEVCQVVNAPSDAVLQYVVDNAIVIFNQQTLGLIQANTDSIADLSSDTDISIHNIASSVDLLSTQVVDIESGLTNQITQSENQANSQFSAIAAQQNAQDQAIQVLQANSGSQGGEREITLSLINGPPVAGVSYNTLQEAYEYADQVLQVGGKLNLNIPANTNIQIPTTLGGNFLIDGNRMQVSIDGASESTSILSAGSLSMNGGTLSLSDLTIEANSGSSFSSVLNLVNLQNITAEDVTILESSGSAGRAMSTDSVQSGTFRDVDFNSMDGLLISDSNLSIIDSRVIMQNPARQAIIANDSSNLTLFQSQINYSSNSLASVFAVTASLNTEISAINVSTSNVTSLYNPAANTFGDFGSIIRTA